MYDQKHEASVYLQFVGTFRRVKFQVEIVDLLDLLFVKKLLVGWNRVE